MTMLINPFRFASIGGGGGPDFANVAFLAGFEGTDGSTAFADESSHARTLTAVGDAQIDTAQFKFGTSSALFDGSGDRISIADDAIFDLGAQDFTFEVWLKAAVDATRLAVAGKMAAGASDSSFYIQRESSNEIAVRFYSGSTSLNLNNVSYPTGGGWNHVVWEQFGQRQAIAVNGVFGASSNYASFPVNGGTDPLLIGARKQGATVISEWNGWQDECRFTIGESVYELTDFTPPAAPFQRS